MANEILVGDVVEWIAPPATVGPHNYVAVATGERRRVVSINSRGDLFLEGENGKGLFGATSRNNVRKV